MAIIVKKRFSKSFVRFYLEKANSREGGDDRVVRFTNIRRRGGSTADEVGAAAPPFETDFMLLSSDFSPKYCIFIVTAPPFCLTAPPFKNSWIRH